MLHTGGGWGDSPFYLKRFECLEKRYINVTNYYIYIYIYTVSYICADFMCFMTLYVTDLKKEVWIGLLGNGNTSVFEWVNKAPVSFTYWARAQPPPLLPNTIHCVYYSGEVCVCVCVFRHVRLYHINKSAVLNISSPLIYLYVFAASYMVFVWLWKAEGLLV